MNTIPEFRLRTGRYDRVLSCPCLLLALALPSFAATPAAPDPEPKTHFLFMGADIDVQKDKQFCRVRGVDGAYFVVRVGDHDDEISMHRGNVNMKVYNELKLAEASATLVDLKTDRAYTPGADPVRRSMRQQAGSAPIAESSNAQFAMNNAISLVGSANRLSNAAAARGDGFGVQAAQQEKANAEQAVIIATNNFNNANLAERSMTNDAGASVNRMQGELDKELFDAIEVEFQVSSPQPLLKPYVVIVAQYREDTEKPGSAHNFIYAAEIAPIDGQPRKVHIRQGGLPPGFILMKSSVHLYNRGAEVATNVAEKRVPLTRDEAFEYILMDYLGSHKEATVAAAPAMGRVAPGMRDRLAKDTYRQDFYVKVGKDGLPITAYADAAHSQKVEDELVVSLINHVRFKPALEKGKPVEGFAKLRFSDLTL